MRSIVIAVLMSGLVFQGSLMAAGYPDDAGPGSINWPPPGGAYNVQPVAPRYPASDSYIFRSGSAYQHRPRYQPSFHSHNPQYIAPPGEDWPGAEYAKPQGGEHVEKGTRVEVIPPPNIPVDAVGSDLSRKPQRDWRPMEKGPRQLREPAQGSMPATPEPEKAEEKAQAVDVIPTPAPPQQKPVDVPDVKAEAKPVSQKKPELPVVSGMPLSKPVFYNVPVAARKASGDKTGN